MNFRNVLTIAALVASPLASASAQVWGTNTNMQLTGTREGAVLTTSNTWSTFVASWTIIPVGNNWSYSYSFFSPDPDISHLILGLTDSCTSFSASATPTTSTCIWNLQYNGSGTALGTWGASNSNPGFPESETFWGIKLDNTTPNANGFLNVTFMSDRAPVWGDFYAKGGNNYAFNDGLLAVNTNSNDINMFIARPNGALTTVPEPSTYVLMMAGLAGLGFAARRRRA